MPDVKVKLLPVTEPLLPQSVGRLQAPRLKVSEEKVTDVSPVPETLETKIPSFTWLVTAFVSVIGVADALKAAITPATKIKLNFFIIFTFLRCEPLKLPFEVMRSRRSQQ